ncbi:MAG: hypothetical protein RIC15_03795 [Vicingaceae bacterium]
MRKFIFIIPLTLLFAQCSTPYTAEISRIDSLITLMDSAKVLVSKVDSGIVHQRRRLCEKNMKRIVELTDTVSREEVFMLDRYGAFQKAYTKWGSKMGLLSEEVEVIPVQLRNLRTDLSKNLIPQEKVRTYLENEEFAAVAVYQTCQQMYTGLQSIDKAYLEAEEKVLLLIQRLESEN